MRKAWCSLAFVALLADCKAREIPQSVSANINTDSTSRQLQFDRLPEGPGPIRIEQNALLTIGGTSENDSLEFDSRTLRIDIAELPSGDLVVADHQRLKYFDARGTLRRFAGRAGSGPGEFSAIRELCGQADSSIVVIDDDGRWSQWSHEGEHVRTRAREGFIPPHACAPNGMFLAQIAGPGDVIQTAGNRRTVGAKLFSVDGAERADIGAFPAPEYFGQIFYEPGYWLTSTSLVVADPRTFEIRKYRARRLSDSYVVALPSAMSTTTARYG